jgi:hypothetical protein
MMDRSRGEGGLSATKRALLARLLAEQSVPPAPGRIRPRERPDPLPLSLNQEGLWFLEELHPGEANHNVPGAVRLTGRLHTVALERSLATIVARHESLRTTFHRSLTGAPCQRIEPASGLMMPLEDLRALPASEREAVVVRLATIDARTPFDLGRGPLFRVRLLRLDDEEHVLLLSIHHIVCDGWSMGVFTRELAALYGAHVQGRPPVLPELPVQCADVALWEREWITGPEARRRLAYWQAHLPADLPVLTLPTDRPRGPVPSFRGRHEPFRLAEALTEAMRGVAREGGATLYMALSAAFRILLHRYTRQRDLVVGTGIAGRESSELEGLIGYFATVLPIRTDLHGDPSFREVLARTRTATLGACANALPAIVLAKALRPRRDPSRHPLFQVELTLLTPDVNPPVYGYGLSAALGTLTLPGVTVTPLVVEGEVSRFDVSLFAWDLPGGLAGTAEYCADLLDRSTVVRMLEDLETLVRAIVVDPEAPLSALDRCLGEAARARRRAIEQVYHDAIDERLRTIRRMPGLPSS